MPTALSRTPKAQTHAVSRHNPAPLPTSRTTPSRSQFNIEVLITYSAPEGVRVDRILHHKISSTLIRGIQRGWPRGGHQGVASTALVQDFVHRPSYDTFLPRSYIDLAGGYHPIASQVSSREAIEPWSSLVFCGCRRARGPLWQSSGTLCIELLRLVPHRISV